MPHTTISDERLQDAVLHVLAGHRGRHRRITRAGLRQALARELGQPVSDRQMRSAIEQLRGRDRAGALICSTTQDGGGYFLAETLSELDRSLREDENRLARIAQRLRAQRRAAGLAPLGPGLEQLELFD